jgi:hypothetical protein
MVLSLREGKSVVRELALQYRRLGKKEKTHLLDYVVSLTGYNLAYAAPAVDEASPG